MGLFEVDAHRFVDEGRGIKDDWFPSVLHQTFKQQDETKWTNI
jgi:hypothetical protein